jgi:hypothetical protein
VTSIEEIPILPIRNRLGRDKWMWSNGGMREELNWSDDAVALVRKDHSQSILVSVSSKFPENDGTIWIHASICNHKPYETIPTYDDLKMLRHAVWGPNGWAFQVFPPNDANINIHTFALHLWGRADGVRTHPDFGYTGTI